MNKIDYKTISPEELRTILKKGRSINMKPFNIFYEVNLNKLCKSKHKLKLLSVVKDITEININDFENEIKGGCNLTYDQFYRI